MILWTATNAGLSLGVDAVCGSEHSITQLDSQ
jgi:hypothetical protein